MNKIFAVLLYVSLSSFFLETAWGQARVTTDCGDVVGQTDSSLNIIAFKGITYAKAQRWDAPHLLSEIGQCWSGVFNASSYGPMCPQFHDGIAGSEDCLSVNVFVPTNPKVKPLPVMVYMYGGSSVQGASFFDEPNHFVSNTQSVIVVTFNFRVGAFGYLALRALSETSPTGVSGNYGLMDCIAALRWVQKNIASFGGDADKVTIYGQSSGGTNVYALMASPLAKGLFHRALAFSASPRINEPLRQAETDNWVFVQRAGCSAKKNSVEVVTCLRGLSVEQVLNASPMDVYPYWAGYWSFFSTPTQGEYDGGLIIVDGHVLPRSLTEALSTPGFGPDVPFMFGHMSQEIDLGPPYRFPTWSGIPEYQQFLWSNFSVFDTSLPDKIEQLYSADQFDSLQQAYEVIANDIRGLCGSIEVAKSASSGLSSPIYHFLNTQGPTSPVTAFASNDYVPHYPFHCWDLFSLNELKLDGYAVTSVDRQYRKLLQTIYSEFADTGRAPSSWPSYRGTSASGVITYQGVTAQTDLHAERCQLWKDYGFVLGSAWNN